MRKAVSSAIQPARHVAAAGVARQPQGSGVQLHKSGLLFTAKQSFRTWEELGTELFSLAESSTWWIADWLLYGESVFHDRYEEAIRRTSLSYQTLRNYSWVARAFPLSRRNQSLSFSHHLEVAALEQPEQDYWLRKAEELGWSRNKLRREVRSSLLMRQSKLTQSDAGSNDEASGIDRLAAGSTSTPALLDSTSLPEARPLKLQFSAEDLAGLERAANRDGEPIDTWVTKVVRHAIGRSTMIEKVVPRGSKALTDH
ncbi:LmbU family transcriptional regulator [Streptomyces sp. NPDC101175]|uniref:LmbU family transcriptional regulator n=1 Tax=Streptomyces sp. NPDC101175 TaxID=3366123 RepID=UPI003838C157